MSGPNRVASALRVLCIRSCRPFCWGLSGSISFGRMPKIRPENYATGYGFLTDYMAEIFAELRRRNFQTHVSACVNMKGMTGRNQDAIKKTAAGRFPL